MSTIASVGAQPQQIQPKQSSPTKRFLAGGAVGAGMGTAMLLGDRYFPTVTQKAFHIIAFPVLLQLPPKGPCESVLAKFKFKNQALMVAGCALFLGLGSAIFGGKSKTKTEKA